MRIQVTGAGDLYRLAHALNEAGTKNLNRELDKGSREAGQVISKEVADHTNDYIPQGFEFRWERQMQTKVEVRLVQSRRISVVVWAMGKHERRDIRRINEGKLRHPTYGRMRRLKAGGKYAKHPERIVGSHYTNPWAEQRIRPGLVDEPAARAMPKAINKIDDAVKRVVAKIERTG